MVLKYFFLRYLDISELYAWILVQSPITCNYKVTTLLHRIKIFKTFIITACVFKKAFLPANPGLHQI